MRHRLGLRAVLVDLMAGVEIKGDEAMIQALADFSKRNASHVKGILNLTIPLSESPMWILGQYQLGLSTESRRPLEDGQRVRYYRLNSTDHGETAASSSVMPQPNHLAHTQPRPTFI
jgi:hypothetical protein